MLFKFKGSGFGSGVKVCILGGFRAGGAAGRLGAQGYMEPYTLNPNP